MTRTAAWVAAVGLAISAGCSQPAACTLGSAEGCSDGQLCQEVVGGEPACFAPVFVEGRVLDSSTDVGIVGARVVAIDPNGAARSTVVESGAGGAYSLPVAAPRDGSGAPIAAQITLRADAEGYQTFPTAPRTGIPVELSSGVDRDGRTVVMNAATDIALIARPGLSGVARVSGIVDHPDGEGVLVVAEQGGRAISTAITGSDGSFVLFDVPTSTARIAGYRQGLNVTPVDVSVVAPETTGVVLAASTEGLSSVTGNVMVVNAPGGATTSIIFVLESTFIETVARGEAPPGLRVEPARGNWAIEGVAPGAYVALAGFENDLLVRDPDTGIGGTMIVHFTVPETAGTVDLGDGLKVTGALPVLSPGAATIETITTPDPTFTWTDDSSEDGYEVRVYDAFGTLVHENTMVPSPGGGDDATYTWTGATLTPGVVYQFRAWSYADEPTGRRLLSATEDLLGVFVYEP
jgi:hypothetical protein